ncbi:MAG TPA: hypothetical protein VIL33_01195 [Rhodothermia bacterium]
MEQSSNLFSSWSVPAYLKAKLRLWNANSGQHVSLQDTQIRAETI